MKNFYISLLLLGFFAFMPQITKADLIRTPQQQETYEQWLKKVELDLKCVQEKKSKLFPKYMGPVIRLKAYDRYKHNWDTGRQYPPLFNLLGNTRRLYLREGTKNRYFIDEKAFEKESFMPDTLEIDGNFNKDLPVSYRSEYFEMGLHKNCREYIGLIKKGNTDVYYFADVTEVPPNSYLKYLPKSETFKVIVPTDENYKEIVKKHKAKLEQAINKEKQGSN